MARLNEAPIATESIDALKRRFIRQNRELAKTNSAQCLRIRALECDVSRLLSENLNLREEILRLQSDVAAAQTQPSNNFPAVLSVKDQLEAKLREFGALVSELGNLQLDPVSHSHSLRDASKRERNPSSWRPEVPIAALSGQSQIMSEIIEEKASPGGTFHNNDNPRVQRLSSQSTDSPDLGPPPIAHFECNDPIKFDPSPRKDAEPAEELNDSDVIHPSLAVNLETRRRRKDTHTKGDTTSSSVNLSDADVDEPPSRPSSKRKLSVRDAEDSDIKPTKDDFVFSRRSSVNGDARKNNTCIEVNTERTITADPPNMAVRSERRVLGDKSVNMSPRKINRPRNPKADANLSEKPMKESAKGQARERKPRISAVKPIQVSEPVLPTVELPSREPEAMADMAPKTPAADLFSPTPSEPSASRLEGRDTPPPSGLNAANTTSSSLNGASRPSRRARAAVNYAEPNLISKMRRPTKTLADAVALGSRHSISSVPDTESKKTMRTVVIKQEDCGNSAWKMSATAEENDRADPASPLGRKSDKAQGGGLEGVDSSRGSMHVSASQRDANTVPMTDNPSAKLEIKVEEGIDRSQEMDLYEFKDSSSAELVVEKEAAKASSRRHSSISGAVGGRDVAKRRMSKIQQQLPIRDKGEGQLQGSEDVEGSAGLRRADRGTARRRSMMV